MRRTAGSNGSNRDSTKSASKPDNRQSPEFRIADNLRNIDYCIHHIDSIALAHGDHGTEQSAKVLCDGIGDLFRLLQESESLSFSLDDKQLKIRTLTLLQLVVDALNTCDFSVEMFFYRKEYAKVEEVITEAVDECRILCDRNCVKLAAELEAHNIAASGSPVVNGRVPYKAKSPKVQRAIKHLLKNLDDPDYNSLTELSGCSTGHLRALVCKLRKRDSLPSHNGND